MEARGRRRLLIDIGPLRESPAFRRLWAGSTLSSVGSALTGFAVPLQVYDITRSPVAVGAIGVAQMVPALTVGLLGGQLADAIDRRKLVVVTSCCLAAVSAALAAQAFAGLPPRVAVVHPRRRAIFAQRHQLARPAHVRPAPTAGRSRGRRA